MTIGYDGHARVTVIGDVDDANEDLLHEALLAGVSAEPEVLILDLSEVGAFGSVGVRCIVRASGLGVGAQPPMVIITEPGGLAAEILAICGVDGLPRVSVTDGGCSAAFQPA